MTREEFAYELEIQPRFFESGEFDCNYTNALELAEKLFCIIDSLEQQNTELQKERANMQATHQSTIESYRKDIAELQARIRELEGPKTCASCKYMTANSDCSIRRVCTLDDGTVDTGIIEVTETFFCSSYAPKQNHVH